MSAFTQFAAVFCLRARVQAAYRLSACANAVCVLVGVALLVLIAAAPPPTFLTHCAPGFWADNATNGICDRNAYIAYVAGARNYSWGSPWMPAANFSAAQEGRRAGGGTISPRRSAAESADLASTSVLGIDAPYTNPLYRVYCREEGGFPPYCANGTVFAPDLGGLATVFSNKKDGSGPLDGDFGVTLGFSDNAAAGGASFASLDLIGTDNSTLPPPLPFRVSRVVAMPGGDAIAESLYASASAAAAAATPLNGSCATGSA